MKPIYLQILGIILTVIYGGLIFWLYLNEPKNLTEVATKTSVTVGTYQINQQNFDEGLRLFRQENYRASREEFAKADPEKRDAKTQFYIAYAFYREGWGRVYNDNDLFKKSLEQVKQVILLDTNFKTDDADLKCKSPLELKEELEKGTETTIDDLNPMKVLRERK